MLQAVFFHSARLLASTMIDCVSPLLEIQREPRSILDEVPASAPKVQWNPHNREPGESPVQGKLKTVAITTHVSCTAIRAGKCMPEFGSAGSRRCYRNTVQRKITTSG